MRALSVVGNRPQFIKSAPVSLALRAAAIDEVVLHTGQHYDRELSDVFFEELGLGEPKYSLGLRTSDAAAMTPAIHDAVAQERPDWVLVYGDTNSTLAGARAAGDVPVAHVEAGLRSFDLTMPEERNRIAVDSSSALLLCPDERSAAQLESEGVTGRREVVGDVMADALRIFAPIALGRSDIGERVTALTGDAVEVEREYGVLTIHREANVQESALRRLLTAVGETGATIVFPVHPRTRATIERAGIELSASVIPIEPLGYLDMLALIAGSRAVLTDSGGLQKEAYWLRKPCITLRPSTEWVDTVRAGANVLVDPADPARLAEELATATFPASVPDLYGDGHASERIAAALYASRP